MKLAVIMAVHNQAATLKDAVLSILNQTYKTFEFIIVDDASTDESATILTKFALEDKRLKIITNKNHLGLTKSLNKALAQTKAEYIARMDADDLSLPKRLATQVEYLDDHPNIFLLGTAVYLVNQDQKQLGLKRHPSDHQHIQSMALRACPFVHPTWMFRRSILRQTGDYREDFPFSQDYELALRIISKYQTANLPQPLLRYRVDSPSAISFKNLKHQERLALKARWLAITRYGYPKTDIWKLIKPWLSYLLPRFIKLPLYRKFFWKNQ